LTKLPCSTVTNASTSTYSTCALKVGCCGVGAGGACPAESAVPASRMAAAAKRARNFIFQFSRRRVSDVQGADISGVEPIIAPRPRYTGRMDIAGVQSALKAEGIDAWLLYDFRGLNPIAVDVTGVGRQGGHLATRRWYYLVPASGLPRGLVHAIEPNALSHLPGSSVRYAGRDQLEAGLGQLVNGVRRVAME